MKLYITIALLLLFKSSYSQQLIQQFDGINFNINGNNSYAPFNGGANNSRFQLIDIDGDSDLDLFTFDADTSLYYYENTGTPQNASYKLRTQRFQGLHFNNWFYFADMDADSDYDLFTGGEFQVVKYFRNTGTINIPNFELIINELHTNSDTVIYSESNCVPIFCDIDGDGDKDFFTGQSLGTITYYENIGTPNNFSFKYITDFWQNLLILSPAFDERHGANSLEFVDIDNDNDFDLFWGDLFSKGIYFIRNDGTATSPDVVIADSTYPQNSPFISSGYNSLRFADIDADGDKDLFISVLYLSQNSKNFTLYKNEGSASSPNFQFNTNNYLRNVDAGGTSNISFTDIDNDGDEDLFVGSDYAKISFYKNTGTIQSPSFILENDSLPILSSSFNYAPAFADLDNDGDQDMLLGSYIKDSLWYLKNTGTPENFNFTFQGTGNQFGLTTLGQSSTPAFVDIDADGDEDLFVGGTNGRLIYYQNTGTAQNFNFTLVTNFYNSIDAGDESTPRFFDIDGDSDPDMFIGKLDGTISYYRNEGSPSSANFVLQTANYKNINVRQSACTFFTDIDADTDLDLFIGNTKGGIYYFRNDDVSSVNIVSNEVPSQFQLYQNYPNPFNPLTVIRFDINGQTSDVKLIVYDILGKAITTLVNEKLSSGSYEVKFGAGNYPSGIYFYTLTAGSFRENKKMLYLK
ncbi:MAG: FG-GAP-like repeat-containing protein [bacterium]|nr:FG-GAP-like repeat-containing protein [bacterium]